MDNNDYRTDRMDEEGYEYGYDYHYVGPQESEDEQDEEEEGKNPYHRPKRKHRKLFVTLQMAVCGTVLVTAMLLKMLGGPAYLAVKDWYISYMNDSIIAQESFHNFTQAWVRFFAAPASGGEVSSVIPPQASSTGDASSQPPAPSSAAGAVSSAPQQSVPVPDSTKNISSVAYTTSIDSRTPVFVSVFLDFPVKGGVITSAFGMREQKPHKGIDIGAPAGSTITPAMAGRVEFSGESSSYGNYILIDHGSHIKTRYAHCEKLLVKTGEVVSYGQPIALVGSTGESTGPHLHFELILSDVCYDPQPLLKNRLI